VAAAVVVAVVVAVAMLRWHLRRSLSLHRHLPFISARLCRIIITTTITKHTHNSISINTSTRMLTPMHRLKVLRSPSLTLDK
jgi:hypothetical protein